MSKLEIFTVVFTLSVAIFPWGIFVPDTEVCNSLYLQGYEGCSVTDRNTWTPRLTGSCGTGDHLSATVTTTNPRGRVVSVTVCCGYFVKACTIRAR